MLAIYKREMQSFFTSMLAYIFIGVYVAITGVFFMYYCLNYALTDFAAYVLPNTTIVYMVLIPIITMRLLSEEKKQKTDQLLLTSPIKVIDIVMGKYLAVLSVYFVVIVCLFMMPVTVSFFGKVDWASTLVGFLGYFLMGAALLAIGLFISSLTENQIIAAVISFAIILGMYFVNSITSMLPGRARWTIVILAVFLIIIMACFYYFTKNVLPSIVVGVCGIAGIVITYLVKPGLFDNGIANLAGWFSVMDRFSNFSRGILDVSSIVYYVSFVGVFIFLSVQSIEKRRWN